jgi:ABC-type multidrug transport system fused ATPase/permease subunit
MYSAAVNRARAIALSRSNAGAIATALPVSLMFFMFGLLMWFGAVLVTDPTIINSYSGDKWTGGDCIRVFFLSFVGAIMLGTGFVHFAAVGLAHGTAKRVMDTIDLVPDIDSYSDEGAKPPELRGEVRFEKISFAYPTRASMSVFAGLDLLCEAGKRTALVGGSGAGKSTLISLVLRFYDVTAGRVLLDGGRPFLFLHPSDLSDVLAGIHSRGACHSLLRRD